MMKRDIITSGKLIKIPMIRNDRWNLDPELSRAISEQQIVQAVPDFRHHDHHSRFHRRVVQFPFHAELIGERGERLTQRVEAGVASDLLEVHAHEKFAGVAVAELRGIENIAAEIEQESGYGMDNAGTIRTRQLQDKTMFGRHEPILL